MALRYRLLSIITALMVCFLTLTGGHGMAVNADDGQVRAFDSTDVLDDLQNENLTEYEGVTEPKLITILEFAFSESVLDSTEYALYAYVYSPYEKEFSTRADANVISMATAYRYDEKLETYEPTGYDNIRLIYCGKALDGKVYKYRIDDRLQDGVLKQNARAQDKQLGERRYDVAGIQLHTQGETYARDYEVSKAFYYEGYAKGLGADGALTSTLSLKNQETVQLNVHQTYFRGEGNNGRFNHQDTMTSVYFNIPNYVIEKYGALYAVHAEYYKAQLKPAIVTNVKRFYDKHFEFRFQDQSQVLYSAVGADSSCSILNQDGALLPMEAISNTIWKPLVDNSYAATVKNDGNGLGRIERLDTVMYAETDNILEYEVRGEEILAFLEANSQNKDVRGRYDSRYFTYANSEPTPVKFTKETKLDKLMSITYSSWWDRTFGNGTTTEFKDICAIQEVKETGKTAEQIEREYYVDTNDYDELMQVCLEPLTTTYVFHFAQDDYFSERALIFLGNTHPSTQGEGYFLQQSLYLDLDVIDVTLKNEQGERVLGVIADPIDVIADGTKPIKEQSFWEWLLELFYALLKVFGIVMGVLLVAVLWGPITFLLKGIWTVITSPIKAFIDWIKNGKDKQ